MSASSIRKHTYILKILPFSGIAIFLATVALSICASAQVDFTRIYGPEDQAVPIPQPLPVTGRRDAPALQAIIDFLAAVNPGNWTGLQASGTLVNGSGEQQSAATLFIGNGDEFRLDVSAPDGQQSTRIHGVYGEVLESNGTRHRLSPAMAANGLLGFPRLFVTSFPDSRTSLIDAGMVSIDGSSLHRVTIERSIAGASKTALAEMTSVVDLYFDPTTHLLIKSASSPQIDPADREHFLLVMTYSNYSKVGQSLLPFSYHQTLNGQPQWTLHLSNVQLNPALNSSQFQF